MALATGTIWAQSHRFRSRFHQRLGNGDVITVNDAVAPFHAVRLVPANLHADNLGHAGAPHVGYCRSAQIMK